MTDACTATDTANAGVRWRGWLSTHSFDARTRQSAGGRSRSRSLTKFLQGTLDARPFLTRLPAVERWPGVAAVERHDVARQGRRRALESPIRQLVEQLRIGFIGERILAEA